jgi:hypothetical protein
MTGLRVERLGVAVFVILVYHQVAAVEPSAPTSEPLPLNSQYKGKLTQQGKHPDVPKPPAEFDCILVITKRQKDDFEAEMRLKGGGATITYLANGTVSRSTSAETSCKVDFQWVGMKNSSPRFISIPGVPLTGTLEAGKLKGTWRYPKNDRGITLEGTFELQLDEKKGDE